MAGGACSVEGVGVEEGVAAEVFMDEGVEAVGDHRGVGGEAEEEATMTGEVGDAIDAKVSLPQMEIFRQSTCPTIHRNTHSMITTDSYKTQKNEVFLV